MLGFQDETWWTRLAQPDLFAWAAGEPLRLAGNARDPKGGGPEAVACYGVLRLDTGAMMLRFCDGRPVSATTEEYLGWVCDRLAAEGKRVFVLVNHDAYVSEDDGASWRTLGVRERFPWHYVRSIAARPDDPRVLFITLGDATPGRTGAVMRSTDAGDTWESLPLPGQPNSAMWKVAIARDTPDVMFAGSRYGNLFRSEDGGDSWVRYWREFSEISSIAWVPN